MTKPLYITVAIIALSGFIECWAQLPYTEALIIERPTVRTKKVYYSVENRPFFKQLRGTQFYVNLSDTVYFDYPLYLGQSLFLINNSDSIIHGIRSRLPEVHLEKLNTSSGKFERITDLTRPWCGYGIQYIDLPPGHYIKLIFPRFQSGQGDQFRYVFQIHNERFIYSDIFSYE